MLLGTSTLYVTRLWFIFVFVLLPSFTLPVELVLCLFPSCIIDHSLYCFCWLFECMLWQPRQTANIYWQSSCLWKAIKEGHDMMQRKKKLHCLLNLSIPIRYQNPSSYTEIHVVAMVYLLLWWIFINSFNCQYFMR